MTTSRRARTAALFASLSLAALGLSCSNDNAATSNPATDTADTVVATTAPAPELPTVVVTYSVLAAVVSELVDGVANVVALIPDGQDPHDFQPSAKDIETINNAALVVSNGLEFEEGLEEVLENIADSGGNIFMVGDHITVRKIEDGDEHSDEHTGGDPHLWLSPATMLEMLPALTTALSEATGADLSAEATDLTTKLQVLDGEVESIIKSLDECKLVSGHDEMGYFADRYGCEVIGVIIPSFTTTSEATAGELAELKKLVEQNKVPAIFTGLGVSPDTATQLAKELGIKAVMLSTHYLDGAANYQEFILKLTNQIAEALG